MQSLEPGCCQKGPCKYGFPMALQPLRSPVLSPVRKVYQYYRPRHCDRNVVPYHPTIMRVWSAHSNLQLITNDSWSYYILKYAMKVQMGLPNTADRGSCNTARLLAYTCVWRSCDSCVYSLVS